MKKFTLLLSFIACVAMVSAQNLVQNGSFEAWTGNVPNNWTMLTGGSGATAATNIVLNGTTSCKVAPTATTNWSQSTITVVPGKTYELSISYYIASGDGTDARLWCNFKNSTAFFTEQELVDTGLYPKLRGPGNANSSGANYFPDEKGAWKTYTTSFIAPANAVNFDFQFRTYNGATVYWDKLSLTSSTPTITVNPTTPLSGFTYAVGEGPSAEQSFTVEGADLTNDIIITPPTNYEISETTGTGFTSSAITLAQSAGAVASTTIYIRLKENLAVGEYNNETITISSTGATDETVICNGEVTTTTGLVNTSADKTIKTTEYYNLQGTQIAEPIQGQTCIKKVTFENGSVETSKVVVKK